MASEAPKPTLTAMDYLKFVGQELDMVLGLKETTPARTYLKKAMAMLEANPPSSMDGETIAQAIWENDDFQDALEMIRQGIKQEQFTAYTKILQAIKSEIDASEGTKSE